MTPTARASSSAGLWLCCLWALAPGGASAGGLHLHCNLSYAGATQTVQAWPVPDPYTVPSVDVRGRFRFKPVLVGTPERLERVNLYVYFMTDTQPVLVQQAKFLPPFGGLGVGEALPLTGEQRVYAGPLERELMYDCQLRRGRL